MIKKTPQRLPKEAKLFGRNFKAARESTGMSQYDVSRKSGIAQPDISIIEAGGYNLTLARMAKLAKVVGTSVRDLLEP